MPKINGLSSLSLSLSLSRGRPFHVLAPVRNDGWRLRIREEMTGVFSVHDIDYLWQSAPEMDQQPSPDGAAVLFHKLNRSSSDWALDSFIQEASNSTTFVTSSRSSLNAPKQEHASANRGASFRSSQQEIGVGEIDKHSFISRSEPPTCSEECQAILRGHLDLECAAVANTRVTSGKLLGSSPPAENSSDASKSSKLGSHVLDAAPTFQKKSGGQGGLTASDSSRELSDDDDLDGDLEAMGNANTPDDKRARRMLSNRESARRSRRRKQEHMNELEMQVAQLKVENSSLSQRMTSMSQKYKDSAVDNRVLKANIETLRAKVKMAEEAVKRATGINPVTPSVPTMPWQSFSGTTLGVNPTMRPGGSFDENLP